MTAPRQIEPRQFLSIVRRVAQRQCLLLPDAETREIFGYCLAEAAKRSGIAILAWDAMSTHYHAVIYDHHGRAPKFIERLHWMLAKVLNARFKRWEAFWSSEETCITKLATPEDVFAMIVYVLCNPVKAHLVERVAHWPGSCSLAYLDGRVTTHKRPRYYFSEEGSMPETVELRVTLPPSSRPKGESEEAWVARLRAAVTACEEALIRERRAEGRRVLGRKAVLATDPFSSPDGATAHRKLRPTLACKDEETRRYHLERLAEFRRAYREARNQFMNGARDVVFPAGTYRMRLLGARCAPFSRAA